MSGYYIKLIISNGPTGTEKQLTWYTEEFTAGQSPVMVGMVVYGHGRCPHIILIKLTYVGWLHIVFNQYKLSNYTDRCPYLLLNRYELTGYGQCQFVLLK